MIEDGLGALKRETSRTVFGKWVNHFEVDVM